MARGSAFEDAWRRRFARRGATCHDEAGIAGWSSSGLDGRFRRFRKLWARASAGDLWLDAGCGAGTYSRYLRGEGLRVLGVDYSPPSLAKAREFEAGEGWWVAGDVKRLPLPPESVDGVLCFGVMQALEDPEPAVRELLAVTRPGGVVWLDGLNRWCLPNLLRELRRKLRARAPHLRYDGPWALKRALLRGGAECVDLYWLPLAPGRFTVLRRLFEHPATQRLFGMIPPLGMLASHSFILVARRPAGREREVE